VIFTWSEFINEVSEKYISGMGESEISEKLAGSYLTGCGTIDRVETDSSIASAFIQLNMPRVEVPSLEKVIVGDFIALNFSELDEEMLKGRSDGDSLSFTTRIIKSNGPFPGVGVSEFEDEREILIMLGTKESKIA
jgi:hypothetical protein